MGPAQRDPFLAAMLDARAVRRRRRQCRPPRVAAMPGGEELAAVRSPGHRTRNTARSGIRRSRRTGCRIAMADGPMSRLGAGHGWTASPGVSRRSTTAAGCRSGGRWGWYPGRVRRRQAGLCAGAGDLLRRRRSGGDRHRRGAGRRADRLVPTGPARGVSSLVSHERPLCAAGERGTRHQLHDGQPQRHDQQLHQPRCCDGGADERHDRLAAGAAGGAAGRSGAIRTGAAGVRPAAAATDHGDGGRDAGGGATAQPGAAAGGDCPASDGAWSRDPTSRRSLLAAAGGGRRPRPHAAAIGQSCTARGPDLPAPRGRSRGQPPIAAPGARPAPACAGWCRHRGRGRHPRPAAGDPGSWRAWGSAGAARPADARSRRTRQATASSASAGRRGAGLGCATYAGAWRGGSPATPPPTGLQRGQQNPAAMRGRAAGHLANGTDGTTAGRAPGARRRASCGSSGATASAAGGPSNPPPPVVHAAPPPPATVRAPPVPQVQAPPPPPPQMRAAAPPHRQPVADPAAPVRQRAPPPQQPQQQRQKRPGEP